MTKSKKIFLGIISFLPLILLVLYLGSFMVFFISIFPELEYHDEYNGDPGFMLANMVWVIGIAIIMGIVSLAAFVYFIIHAINNKNLESTERLAWILIFVFANIIGYPIYWYLKIWKGPDMTLSAPIS